MRTGFANSRTSRPFREQIEQTGFDFFQLGFKSHFRDPDRRFNAAFARSESRVFVDFQESGAADYLGEAAASSVGTAGVDRTSADAVVKFVREDGATQVVLIDWKYAESYGGEDLRWFRDADGDPATDRASIYRAAWERDAGPIEKALFLSEAGYEDLFVEPFYGFMRLQLLAAEIGGSRA